MLFKCISLLRCALYYKNNLAWNEKKKWECTLKLINLTKKFYTTTFLWFPCHLTFRFCQMSLFITLSFYSSCTGIIIVRYLCKELQVISVSLNTNWPYFRFGILLNNSVPWKVLSEYYDLGIDIYHSSFTVKNKIRI